MLPHQDGGDGQAADSHADLAVSDSRAERSRCSTGAVRLFYGNGLVNRAKVAVQVGRSLWSMLEESRRGNAMKAALQRRRFVIYGQSGRTALSRRRSRSYRWTAGAAASRLS